MYAIISAFSYQPSAISLQLSAWSYQPITAEGS
jgi:hypothetical protein